MAFTNTWDNTTPADTQLANLLGQDLRALRVDVQQRMAAISGLDASKPSFGSDSQPASWNGVLFFATDTGKIYQFSNPNWTDVTTDFIVTADLSPYALLASPAFTGTPVAPTPAASDSSTTLATTAFAHALVILGFSISAALPGYIKFPSWLGGFTIQWATGSPSANTVNVAFPTTWPVGPLAVFGTTKTGTQTFSVDISGTNWAVTGNGTYWLLAIGH